MSVESVVSVRASANINYRPESVICDKCNEIKLNQCQSKQARVSGDWVVAVTIVCYLEKVKTF